MVQEPNKVELWKKRHFKGKKNGDGAACLKYSVRIFVEEIFIKQIHVLNILNMLHNLVFFSSKLRLFHNATLFGYCIIHILNTGWAKIKKKIRRQRVKLKCIVCEARNRVRFHLQPDEQDPIEDNSYIMYKKKI
jgi:hypothetical protein